MADPRIRQLTIKSGIVKRLTKEKVVYEREAVAQRNHIDKLKREGADEYVLRKQDEVLQEALMIIPDSQRRLGKAFEDLDELLKGEIDLKDTPAYETAFQICEDAKEHLVRN